VATVIAGKDDIAEAGCCEGKKGNDRSKTHDFGYLESLDVYWTKIESSMNNLNSESNEVS